MSAITRRSFMLWSATLLLAGCGHNSMEQEESTEPLAQDVQADTPTEAATSLEDDQPREDDLIHLTVTINDHTYPATLIKSETTSALVELLPLSVEMSELNGNEKYFYLKEDLPCADEQVGFVEAGDLMLFGPDCLVLFYDSFDTSYTYTRLGKLDDRLNIADAVGAGSATVTIAQA